MPLFELLQSVEHRQMRLQSQHLAALPSEGTDEFREMTFPVPGWNNPTVSSAIFDVEIVDIRGEPFEGRQRILAALQKICGVKDRFESGERMVDILAARCGIAIDSFFAIRWSWPGRWGRAVCGCSAFLPTA